VAQGMSAAKLALLVILASVEPGAAKPTTAWVATWTAAPQEVADAQAQHFDAQQTVRLITHVTLGGQTLRLRISNLYGAAPLDIGAAHVAVRTASAQVDPNSDRPLTFGGRTMIVIPPHGSALSDPVSLDVRPESDLAVSLYLPEGARGVTAHVLAKQTNYAAAKSGDLTAAADFPVGRSFHAWPFVTAVEVRAPRPSAAVVAFGDSLVDGDGSTTDSNQRWPDLLASRLLADGKPLAVVNEGIIANRLLRGVAPEMRAKFGGIPGDSALARFDRDVLSQSGVRCVIVRTGTNDLGFPGSLTPIGESESAERILDGYERLAGRAHARGISIIVTTIPPFEGANFAPSYYSPGKELVRQEVNDRLRRSKAFDGLIDFDLVLRDASRPSRIDARYDSGDHLHPNDAGYRALADSIPLSTLWPRCAVR
jgi:lysophospholipase L1-like esterase